MNPRELDTDDVKQELDAALGAISDAEMEAAAGQRKAARPDERGRVRGTVVDVRGADVLVDIGGKSEAWVGLDHFDADDPPAVGQVRFFIMQGFDRETGAMRLGLREARADADLTSLNPGDVVEARVTGMNTGGLELTVKGLRGFMPKSQVDVNRIEDFAPLIGRKLDCEITEVDRRGKTVVLSRRRVLERQRESLRQELKYSLAEGQTRKGVVKRLADFGAFVDIGGIDGLLHISDLSYARVKHPSDVLQVGQEVEVQILKIDPAKDRISLGMKQLAADPWNVVEANYRVGNTVDGRVMRLLDFGAFVELEPGVEGLLPVSEISWTQRFRHPKEILKEGDPVRVSVIALDAANRKLTLSLKALSGDPWKDVAERYTPDSVVSGRVMRITEFGAFVQLEEGVEGLVHISEISDKRIRAVSDVLKPDEVVQVRVKSVDTENHRVSLSLRGIGADGQAAPVGAAAAGASSGAPAHAAPMPPTAPPKRKKALKGGLE